MLLMLIMSIYTVLTPYENQWYDFNKEFCKPDLCENRGSYHNAGGHPKCGKFVIKMYTTKMGLNLDQADIWFNPWVLSFD